MCLPGISEIDDLGSMREQSQKLLERKVLEVAEEQRKIAGTGANQKVATLYYIKHVFSTSIHSLLHRSTLVCVCVCKCVILCGSKP